MNLLTKVKSHISMKIHAIVFYSLIILLCNNVCSSNAATQTLTLSLTGSGGGSINSIPSGIACTSSSCQSSFTTGTSVSLTAIPNSISNFTSWSGACTSTSNTCSVTMHTDTSVAADFTSSPRAMIASTGYASLADAYSSATNGVNIMLLTTDALESLNLNRGIAISITGGCNASFSSCNEMTSIDSPLIISNGSLNVSGVEVTTGTNTYSISGTVTLASTGVQGIAVALSNASNTYTVSTGSLGDFSLSGIPNGNYTISAAAPGYTTSASQPIIVNGLNINGISFTATTPTTITATVTGLQAGQSVQILDNGGDSYVANTNGAFSFATAVATGANYDVTVATQPSAQTCNVLNGVGTVGSASVTGIQINCGTFFPTYTIAATVNGLQIGQSVKILDNCGDGMTLTTNGLKSFATPLATGTVYAVTVGSQPTTQVCNIVNGTGVVGSANVTNVQVNCSSI